MPKSKSKKTRQLEKQILELDKLVEIISHDLRIPLHTITNATYILGKECKGHMDPEQYKEVEKWLDLINNHVNRSMIILNDSSAYIETRKVEYEFSRCNMYKILDSVLHDYSNQFEEANIKVTNNLEPGLEVCCDKNKMERVWTNYLTNAIKYSREDEPDKRVEIGYTVEENFYKFYVKDNGIGIAREDLPKIGIPYERFHDKKGDGTKIPGTGLGIVSVCNIIAGHGGRTLVESDGLGRGSTFYFTLPIKSLITSN